ncbi:MAG: hypothetical protein ACOC6F_03025 [bacterium]
MPDTEPKLEELQQKLMEKEGFGEALQRLRRTQKMLGSRRPEVEIVFPVSCGQWETFRAYSVDQEHSLDTA